MTSVGRNDPCPCGSGRKFKRCCADGRALQPHTVTQGDVARACEALDRLTTAVRFQDDEVRAREMCFGPEGFPAYDPEANADLAALYLTLFQEWFWFDCVLHTGMTAAATLLAGDVSALDIGARRALSVCAGARLRCLRVDAVDPGERLWVSDAIDATVAQRVADADASREFVPGDALLARPAEIGDRRQIVGVSCRLGRDEPVELGRIVTSMRRRAIAEIPEVTPALLRMLDAVAMLRFVMAADEDSALGDAAGGLIIVP
jgi:hypothetical protein